MKRTWRAILALTLVCAVALTAAARALGSKALPLTMTDACTIGDPAAAEGLHMAARIGMEQNRLQWRMDYDPAADTTDASFRLAYSDRSGQWVFDGSGYNIQCLLVDQEDDSDPICREVLRQARASGEELVDVTVHLADYWQDLPLSLSGASWPGGGDFVDVYGPWDIGDTVPFPALSIPVRESDDLTVTLARNADGSYEINGYDFTGISYAMYFTPFSLPLEGGTYRLLQELPLGPVPESDPGTGGYHTLTIRDGFIVVLWDDQLTVLSRTEEGYHLDYTCPTQTAYVTGYTVSFTDPELEKQGDEDAMPYTVAPNFAMAYQDGKLAVAAYIGNGMSHVLLLEVYGPEGLLYATARVPSVERQFAADNVRSMWVREDKKAPFPEADISTPIPELTWEK